MAFPRIGPPWTGSTSHSVEDLARYDSLMIMTGIDNPTVDAQLRAANPDILIYGCAPGIAASLVQTWPEIPSPANWPLPTGDACHPAWVLTACGGELAASMNDSVMEFTPVSVETTPLDLFGGGAGDFVEWADGKPVGWVLAGDWEDGGAALTDLPTGGFTGAHACRVQCATDGYSSMDRSISVNPGDQAFPEVYLKSPSTGASIGVLMQWRDVNGDPIGDATLAPDGDLGEDYIPTDNAWHPCYRLNTMPALAATLFISIFSFGAACDILISDLTNKKTPIFTAGNLHVIGDEASGNWELVRIDAEWDGAAIPVPLDVRGIGNAGACAHDSGERVAENVLTWVSESSDITLTMDVSDNCPSVVADSVYGLAETWAEHHARVTAAAFAASEWDGMLIDVCYPAISWVVTSSLARSIDYDRSNTVAADGYAACDTAWNAGQVNVANLLRTAVGNDALLIGNGITCLPTPPNGAPPVAWNGMMVENFPNASTTLYLWNKVVVGPYDTAPGDVIGHLSLFDTVDSLASPDMTTVYGYMAADPDDEGGITTTDYRTMRWGITTALICGCWFVWEPRNSHSAYFALWADEFDNAGAGAHYLGLPVSAAVQVATNVWWRLFEHGAALANPTASSVTIDVGAPTLSGVWSKINGSQRPTVNDGSSGFTSVTIPAHDGLIILGENAWPVIPKRVGLRVV